MLTGTEYDNAVARAIYDNWKSTNEFRRELSKHLPKGRKLPCQQTISRWVRQGYVNDRYARPFAQATGVDLEDIIR